MAKKKLSEHLNGLVSAFGASFARGVKVPGYRIALCDAELVIVLDGGEGIELREAASEWKRLCGRLWAHALPAEQRDALVVLLPTLVEYDGAIWKPMSSLLDGKTVGAALKAMASALTANGQLVEALYTRLSAVIGQEASSSVPEIAEGQVDAAWGAALKEKGSLSAVALVKITVPFLEDEAPARKLEALVWLREALRESPAKVLAIHRLLQRHVVPMCEDTCGLLREASFSVLERWVTRLIARHAYPEALTMLDALLEYGVGVPKFLAQRGECLLGLADDEGAARDFKRLAAIADRKGYVRAPMLRADSHVRDTEALALTNVAKVHRTTAESAHPFAEKRRKGEAAPTELSKKELQDRCRQHAERALEILAERAQQPASGKYPLSYQFHIQRAKALLA